MGEKTAARHIWIHYLVLFEITSLAIGIQHSLYTFSTNETWNNTNWDDGVCTSVTYDDMITFGKPTDDKDFGPVWLSSENVFSKWINMTGCFSSTIDNKPNETFTTTESCLKFCGGNFGITGHMCVCPESYHLSTGGCLGWNCSLEDKVPCGNTKQNYNEECVCNYVLVDSHEIQTESIGDNCVAYHSNSSSLKAHRCSNKFPPLCVDTNVGTPDPNSETHQWTDAGYHCYGKNEQFYSPKEFVNKPLINDLVSNSSIFWVAIFRINLTSTNLPSKMLTSLYCPAAVKRNIGGVKRVLRPCNDHLPTLCHKEQIISHSTKAWHMPVLIIIIIIVLLIVFIIIFVVVKRRRRKRSTKEKAKVKIPEVRNQSLDIPACNNGNDGPVCELDRGNTNNDVYDDIQEDRHRRRELDRGNTNNDVYDDIQEDRHRRPDDKDHLYDHAPAGNNIYGQLHQRHVTCGESPYDTMAAIRCAEGIYGTTANRSCSVTDDGEYGHLAACGTAHEQK